MSQLEVIGAGFGRTGTYSLKTALEILGYPCHHMETVALEGQGKIWAKIVKGENVEENLEKAMKGKTACLDYPSCGWFQELMALSPNGKVLLSVRDSPEAWVKSANNTIMKVAYEHPFRKGILNYSSRWFPVFGNMMYMFNALEGVFNKCAVGHFVPKYPENRVQYYEDWVAYVKRTVPEDRLLVFNVKEGWEPLCKFLGKPIPNQSFPRLNDTALFHKRQKYGLVAMYTVWFGVYGGLAYTIYTGKAKSAARTLLDTLIEKAKTFGIL